MDTSADLLYGGDDDGILVGHDDNDRLDGGPGSDSCTNGVQTACES
ncbi:hypothetical protein [Streptomyces sp. NPDC006463]